MIRAEHHGYKTVELYFFGGGIKKKKKRKSIRGG